jgi:hypothetical protein
MKMKILKTIELSSSQSAEMLDMIEDCVDRGMFSNRIAADNLITSLKEYVFSNSGGLVHNRLYKISIEVIDVE